MYVRQQALKTNTEITETKSFFQIQSKLRANTYIHICMVLKHSRRGGGRTVIEKCIKFSGN